MDRWYIWHNNRGVANQYFVCHGTKVKFQLPLLLGKIIAWLLPEDTVRG